MTSGPRARRRRSVWGRLRRAPPAAVLGRRGRTVGREIAARDGFEGCLGVHLFAAREPVPGADERDVLALIGAEAEMPPKGRGLEIRAPAVPELLAQRFGAAGCGHRLRELVACEPLRAECAHHALEQQVELFAGDVKAAEPGGLEVVVVAVQSGLPMAVLHRREQVQRATHSPGLHQAAMLPQLPLELALSEAVQARPSRELRCREHLRVKPADPRDHRGQLLSGTARGEVLALRSVGEDVGPVEFRERAHDRVRPSCGRYV